MIVKENLFKSLVKKGYAEKEGARVWDVSDLNFIYITPEMAKSFLELNEHPRYKATVIDAEMSLLKDNISKFIPFKKDSSFNLIDLACIDGSKAAAIIESLPKDVKIRYCPVSVNEYLVNLALENVKSKNFSNVIDYAPVVTEGFELADSVTASLRNNQYQHNIILVLGSVISGYDINDYLFKTSQSMFPGDYLIIGNGIRKGERFVNLETYRHPLFNRWFIHVMRYLGFSDEEIDYGARFANNRLEIYYTIKSDKVIEYNGKEIQFNAGDEVIVAYQNKFFEEELASFCKQYFDDNLKFVKDKNEEYCLICCTK